LPSTGKSLGTMSLLLIVFENSDLLLQHFMPLCDGPGRKASQDDVIAENIVRQGNADPFLTELPNKCKREFDSSTRELIATY
jgi:hypothetical protein